MELLIFIKYYGSLIISISIIEIFVLIFLIIREISRSIEYKKLEKLFHEVDHNFSEGKKENE